MFPWIESAVPTLMFSIGEYEALLLEEIQAGGRVQYHYVLAVSRGDEPRLWVASEYSCAETKSTPILGLFSQGVHSNFGGCSEWLDRGRFIEKALELTKDQLGIPADTVVQVATVQD